MSRNHAIDHLRAAMICVVMFGHALLPYVTVPRRFKDPMSHAAFDVVALFLYFFAMQLRWFAPDQADWSTGLIAGLSSAAVVAGMSFGFLGLFQRRFSTQPSAVGQYLSEASYWIFLIHLPLLIFVTGALSATELPAMVKYLLTVVVVVPALMATYHLLVRNSLLGRLLKGQPKAPQVKTVTG